MVQFLSYCFTFISDRGTIMYITLYSLRQLAHYLYVISSKCLVFHNTFILMFMYQAIKQPSIVLKLDTPLPLVDFIHVSFTARALTMLVFLKHEILLILVWAQSGLKVGLTPILSSNLASTQKQSNNVIYFKQCILFGVYQFKSQEGKRKRFYQYIDQ